MKTLSTALLAAIFALSGLALRAQTADEIANNYVKAIGGRDAVNAVKTLYEEGNFNVMGNDAPHTTYIVNHKALKSQVDFNGQQYVQVVTDQGGWVINPMMGQTTATAMPADQIKSTRYQMDIGGPLLDYKSKGSKLEFLGKDTAAGAPAYKLKLTTSDSVSLNIFIDVSTSYMTRIVTRPPGQDEDAVVTFSDFRKMDGGLVAPWAEELLVPTPNGPLTITMTTKKAEVNKTIDPTIFDMPK